MSAPAPAQSVDSTSPAEGHPGTEVPAGEREAFPPFDSSTFPSQLLWLAITFGVLYWLIAKVAIPRIGGIVAARRERIAGDIASAERMRAESEAAAARYEKSLAEARAAAASIAASTRAKARAEAGAKRAVLESTLAGKLAAADAEIGRIKARALSDVGTISRDAAAEIVKRLTGMDVRPAEAGKAVASSTRQGA